MNTSTSLPEQSKSIVDILEHKCRRPTTETLLSALIAGFLMGLSYVAYLTTLTGSTEPIAGSTKILAGSVFSFGLSTIVILGYDLFTSSVLALLPYLQKKIKGRQILTYWGKVYLGNAIGAILCAFLVWRAKMPCLEGGAWGGMVLHTALAKLSHNCEEALILGAFANMLVCLGAWMSYSGQTVADKVIAVVLPVAIFVASGFEHSIANFFILPLGWLTAWCIPLEDCVGGLLDLSISEVQQITWFSIGKCNLLPVTIGNMLGGVIGVGLTQWYLLIRPRHH